MEMLSNICLQGFDLLFKLMLPFILIGFFLVLAGRKPDAALDAGFSIFGLLIGGVAKLVGLFFRALVQALFPAKARYVPGKNGPYTPGKSPSSPNNKKFAESACQNCNFRVLPHSAFCHNCGCSML